MTSAVSLSSYADGLLVEWIASGTNTTAVTLNINSLGAKAVRDAADTALVAGDLISGRKYQATYVASADRFRLSTGALAAVGPASSVTNRIALFDGTTGKLLKDGGQGLPSGAIVGTTDTQTLTNKTIAFADNTFAGTLSVANGGTGLTTATAYAVLCGGTTSTGAFQSIASVGTSGQILTSNGAGALPTFQTPSSGGGGVGSTLFLNNVYGGF